MLSKNELNDLFEYKDGNLFWKKYMSPRAQKNGNAGSLNSLGYKRVSIRKKSYLMHRVIWTMFNGETNYLIDHIDGNKSNNKIENLRECTYAQNSWNQKKNSTNTAGHKNITWHKRDNRWQVSIVKHGTKYHIGYFSDIEKAKIAAEFARQKFHQLFSRSE